MAQNDGTILVVYNVIATDIHHYTLTMYRLGFVSGMAPTDALHSGRESSRAWRILKMKPVPNSISESIEDQDGSVLWGDTRWCLKNANFPKTLTIKVFQV